MPELALCVYQVNRWKRSALAKKETIAVPPIDVETLSQFLFRSERDLEFLNEKICAPHGIAKGEEIKDFDVTSLGEESSAGYFSTTERIHIVHDHPALPSSLILKSEGGFNESFTKMAQRVRACEREHLFYSKLAPSLPAGIASRLPRVYHTTPASILMEDLAPRAEVANQEEGLDLSFAKEAIVIAASFHAPFWPQPGSRSIPDFVVGGGKPDHWLNLIKCKSADLYSSRGFLGGKGDPEDEKVGKFLHDHADEILSRATKEAPQTLIHADYRAGNLMRVSATGECIVLDWQTCCEGPGLYDVASIAVCSITAEDRKKHCDELLRAYQGALKDRGVDYPWEQLMEDFRVVILQQAFLINYAFEEVSAEDCPLLFTRARRRIMTAISDYNCLDLF